MKYGMYDHKAGKFLPFEGPRLWKGTWPNKAPCPYITDDNPEARRQAQEMAKVKPMVEFKKLGKKDIETINSGRIEPVDD